MNNVSLQLTVSSQLTRNGRVRRLAIAAVIAVSLGLLVSYVLTLVSGAISVRQSDFITYYSTGSLVIGGKAHSIYDFSALANVERRVVHPYMLRYGLLPYVYPPYFALAVAPLARLSLEQAYVLWLGVSLAVLAAFLRVTARYACLHGTSMVLYALSVGSFVPTFICLVHGQTSIVLLALFAIVFFALRAGMQVPAGVALALALIKPPFVLPILLVLVLWSRWRALAGFGATAAVLALAPLLVLGSAADASYLHVLRLASGWTSQFGYSPELSISISGLTGALLPRTVSTPVTLLLDLAALGMVGLAARRQFSLDVTFALAILCGLLISPHVLVHDLAIAALPAAIAIACRQIGAFPLPALLAACYAVMLAGFAAVSIIHVQLAVLAIFLLGWWLWRAAGTPTLSSTSDIPRKAAYGS